MESLEPSAQMLQVRSASGEVVVAMPVGDETTVRGLKRRLQSLHGLPRFRQRLLHGGTILNDDFRLDAPYDLQLVLLNFITASHAENVELLAASMRGDESDLEQILQRPQDPNRPVNSPMGPLHFASMLGQLGIMRQLLEARAQLDDRDCENCQTALGFAAGVGQVLAVNLLLSSKADMEARREGGRTPLWMASRFGKAGVVQVLLDAGAQKDAQDNDGVTPLGAACRAGYVRVVRKLLAAGANPATRNRLGLSPFQAARGRGRLRILRLLSRYKWSQTRLATDHPKGTLETYL